MKGTNGPLPCPQQVDLNEMSLALQDFIPLLQILRMGGRRHRFVGWALREQLPRCRVGILTTFARAGYLRRALELNVLGYLLKDAPAQRLAQAVRQIAAGGRVVDPELALAAWDGPNPLSEREREVLRLARDGLSNAQIARRLRLAQGTVKNYLSEAMQKLHAQNRVHAARIPAEKGWLY